MRESFEQDGTIAIVVAVFVKMFIVNEADAFASGGRSSLGKIAPSRGAKGPSLDRVNLALNRKNGF